MYIGGDYTTVRWCSQYRCILVTTRTKAFYSANANAMSPVWDSGNDRVLFAVLND